MEDLNSFFLNPLFSSFEKKSKHFDKLKTNEIGKNIEKKDGSFFLWKKKKI